VIEFSDRLALAIEDCKVVAAFSPYDDLPIEDMYRVAARWTTSKVNPHINGYIIPPEGNDFSRLLDGITDAMGATE
jgi:hypothetical protein